MAWFAAARNRRRSPPAASRCSCSKAGTACTTDFRRIGGAASRSPSITIATKPSIRIASTAAVSAADEALIRAALADHHPGGERSARCAKTCLYTVTPDHDFIIDRLPGAPQIVVASPCSGHGFKFAPVIGEILADLATRGATGRDIGRFRLSRF